jgi:hypothetical protein
MKPPSVYEVTTPRSHKTNKITKIVHSIFVPISQNPVSMTLAPQLERAFVFSQMASW